MIITPRFGRPVAAVWLTIVWVALWGEASLGNVVAGALVAALVVLAFGRYGPAGVGFLRPLATLRYAVVFAWMLVLSNLAVAQKVLSRKVEVHPVVVVVDLPPTTPLVTTLVANSVTLTPGTLTLDAVPTTDGIRLVVHALDAPDAQAVVDDVRRLHRLAGRAFGLPEPASKGAA